MTRLGYEFEDGYQLEFAIDSENEFKAANILTEIFGKKIKQEISFGNIAKRSDLIFISHRFTEDELTDENCLKLLKHKDTLLIVNDELSAKRAGELMQICIPVETLLKRLLIYVWSEIYAVFGMDKDKKVKIEICRQIYSLYLGKLVPLLETDLTTKNREQLFFDGGKNIINILEESKDFDDLKNKLMVFTKPHTVWEQISVILRKPVPYSEFSKQLKRLKALRDKAAHPQVIFAKDIKDARDCSKHILSKIGEVRNDYYDDLVKSISKLTSTMTGTMAKFAEVNMAKIITETTAALSETLSRAIAEATRIPPAQFDFSGFVSGIDWNAVSSEMKANDLEMKQILEEFEENGAKTTLNKMDKEIKEDIKKIKRRDKPKRKKPKDNNPKDD